MKKNFYKNYMKKIYIIFLICICFFFLSSCINSEDNMIEDSYTETDENNDKETEEDYDKETEEDDDKETDKNLDCEDAHLDFGMTKEEFEKELESKGMTLEEYCESINKEEDLGCDNSKTEGYKTIVQGNDFREYIVYVPESYDGNSPLPLVINFHGFDGCASSFMNDTGGLNNVADSENFFVVYPQGVGGEKGDSYWDPGDSSINDIMENDVYFVRQLISILDNEYNINLSKVYATGYSNGGMMAYGLACSMGDVFSAIGVISGALLDTSCDQDFQSSVIIFHGIEDDVLPYYGNQDYRSISEVVDFWLNHNQIPETSLTTASYNDGNILLEIYENDSNSVVLYTIQYGGHYWFVQQIGGLSPNQLLWNFLNNYSSSD